MRRVTGMTSTSFCRRSSRNAQPGYHQTVALSPTYRTRPVGSSMFTCARFLKAAANSGFRQGRPTTYLVEGRQDVVYVEENTLIAVSVSTGSGFSADTAKPLFKHSGFRNFLAANYDVSADGKFLVIETVGEQEEKPPAIRVVENWTEEHRAP